MMEHRCLLHGGNRDWKGPETDALQRHTLSNLLSPARPHLNFPPSPQMVPPTEDQAFNSAYEGQFIFEP
jgi:hypothetical protein